MIQLSQCAALIPSMNTVSTQSNMKATYIHAATLTEQPRVHKVACLKVSHWMVTELLSEESKGKN